MDAWMEGLALAGIVLALLVVQGGAFHHAGIFGMLWLGHGRSVRPHEEWLKVYSLWINEIDHMTIATIVVGVGADTVDRVDAVFLFVIMRARKHFVSYFLSNP